MFGAVYAELRQPMPHLGDFESLHTFQTTIWWHKGDDSSARASLLAFIGWLEDCMVSLPPSHPLELVIFDITDDEEREDTCYRTTEDGWASHPEDWHRVDEILNARGTVQVTMNLRKHLFYPGFRHVVASAFPRLDTAGMLC